MAGSCPLASYLACVRFELGRLVSHYTVQLAGSRGSSPDESPCATSPAESPAPESRTRYARSRKAPQAPQRGALETDLPAAASQPVLHEPVLLRRSYLYATDRPLHCPSDP
jgi:hypothetical protein